MGKTKSKTSKTVATKPAAPSNVAADIDDIFAGPSKPKAAAPAAKADKKKAKSSSKGKATAVEEAAKGEKKRSKKKAAPEPTADSESEPDWTDDELNLSDIEDADTTRKVLEVVDPSAAIAEAVAATKRAEVAAEREAAKKGKKGGKGKDRKEVEDDKAFRDGRGDGNRKRTEEGFLVFKEAELNIDPEAGGTPLCPFDCECCF